MERILGLDVGDRTVGVAVSDLLGITAQGITTIRREENEDDKAFQELGEIIEEYEIGKIVVGLPKNMDGSLGGQSEKVMEFTKELAERFPVNIEYIDERMTTISAERVLIEGDVSRKKRKKLIDKVAATYILQFYLDSN